MSPPALQLRCRQRQSLIWSWRRSLPFLHAGKLAETRSLMTLPDSYIRLVPPYLSILGDATKVRQGRMSFKRTGNFGVVKLCCGLRDRLHPDVLDVPHTLYPWRGCSGGVPVGGLRGEHGGTAPHRDAERSRETWWHRGRC